MAKGKKRADVDEGWAGRMHPCIPLSYILCPHCRATDKKLKPANFVKVRHILCEKQSKILEAQERIRNGEQFATVASDMSEDKARQGGDLGWKGRQDVVGAFAEAAFKLDVGEMTAAPVNTQFGHHLILCEGRKQKL